ncbi:hypothetical protein [Sporosarcina sp. FA9]|uniref:hypothetical protein n=1 Tax=Sporosarcina sp. FA9 TaxID=3413030 RepID=UPI003F657EAE
MGKLTREVEWFLTTLQNEFGVSVNAEDVAVEATELGMEEVGSFFVPSEVINPLPETLLYELMIIDDKAGIEWVGAIGFHVDSPEWCILIVTKNEVTVYRCTQPLRQSD